MSTGGGEKGSGGGGSVKTPADFLKSIRGRPVVVKLNSGVDYRGRSSPSFFFPLLCGVFYFVLLRGSLFALETSLSMWMFAFFASFIRFGGQIVREFVGLCPNIA